MIIGIALFSVNSCKKDDPITLPILSTSSVSDITSTTAKSGGNITSDGRGTITAKGICWSTSTNPDILLGSKTHEGTGAGIFMSSITGLIINTKYFVRAYATNSAGTAYGNEISFTTNAELPSITTSAITSITATTAQGGGDISSDGGAAVTAKGICWSTTANPTIELSTKTSDGAGIGIYTSSITDLTADTKYYLRAYATNSSGTAYGNEINFTTTSTGTTVTDIDGNIYHTVTIGTQVWMVENLKTIKYLDGTTIKLVTDNSTWRSGDAAYCWYNYNAATYKTIFGALYNWYAVDPASNGGKNICPSSWHVPSDAEWTTLIDYLGGETVAGGKMKSTGTFEAGTGLWFDPNLGATNISGFTALPAGYNSIEGFNTIYDSGSWWTSTAFNATSAWYRSMKYIISSANRYNYYKNSGFSVRCIHD